MRKTVIPFLALILLLSSRVPAALTPEALALRDQGLAELENEKPELAEQTFGQLTELVPEDPLGPADLAIAELRQQKYDAALATIERALKVAPGDPRVLTVRGEILQWTGDLEGAVAVLDEAARAAPHDPEILYAAYQLASTLRSEASDAIARRTLRELAALRPENVVVLLQIGRQAVAEGDRKVATGAFLRLGELLWQEPRAARALDLVKSALEADDLGQARIPAVQLENVLKVSAMFRESLRELKKGIQGIPLARFADEIAGTSLDGDGFGEPISVELAASRLGEKPSRAVAAGDFDGDERPDLASLRADGVVEIRLAEGGWQVAGELAAAGTTGLLAADLDNSGQLDLVAFGEDRTVSWTGSGDGTFAAADFGLGDTGAVAAAAIDFDIEGDLDLALAGGRSGAADLWRNALQGPLERVGILSLPHLPAAEPKALVASDLDRDGDLDLLLAHAAGFSWIDNLRQGRFQDRTARAGLRPGSALSDAVSADLDDDGWPDLVGAGEGLVVQRNRDGRFEPWQPAGLPGGPGPAGTLTAVVAFDADNDGHLDLGVAGPGPGVAVYAQRRGRSFEALPLAGGPSAATALAVADLDADGDLDLVTAGAEGLHRIENRGGNRNPWLAVRLRGLSQGNSKNNFFGVGSVVEVRNGPQRQFRETRGDVTHLGLGPRGRADVLRVVWTNGVPQNRFRVEGGQRIVEEQILKGSCPFLYAWDGAGFSFVTDLLWGAPLGLPVAPGVWASSDPSELVRVDGLVADGGLYRLRITEELWEAAFFDRVSLWVVDHPAGVEVASNLRIVPGETLPERVLGSRDLRPVAAAWDGRGREVTEVVRRRDEVYAGGYLPSAYQGVARGPWTFTFDLGEAPGAPVRLHLDGWIFPSDASLNLAVAQRDDLPCLPPRLEVETADGWQVLMPSTGFPAGKTKTMVIDTPPLPAGARRLRLVTSLWLHWDRIAWTTAPADDVPVVRARLGASSAELRFRGFSAPERRAPNAPHTFDYARVSLDSPWLTFPGHYTRYGDVRRLLETADDLSVILAAGDEVAVTFDARDLPPPPAGWRRTLFLESHGWDKDADRNIWEARSVEPLPFRAMTTYPDGRGMTYPDSDVHRAYRREWLTREVR